MVTKHRYLDTFSDCVNHRSKTAMSGINISDKLGLPILSSSMLSFGLNLFLVNVSVHAFRNIIVMDVVINISYCANSFFRKITCLVNSPISNTNST